MKSKIALFLFALGFGISAVRADPPDNLCYKIYNQCEANPATSGMCYEDLVACLNNP